MKTILEPGYSIAPVRPPETWFLMNPRLAAMTVVIHTAGECSSMAHGLAARLVQMGLSHELWRVVRFANEYLLEESRRLSELKRNSVSIREKKEETEAMKSAVIFAKTTIIPRQWQNNSFPVLAQCGWCSRLV